MRRVRQAIVVEGKHDVIRVQSAVEAIIVPTDGFRIFKDKEKMAMLRRLAAVRGLVVLTDSDSAGGVIRNHLLSCIPTEQVRQAYIPPIQGKEKRKATPSKEGLLGVEGMDAATVVEALERSGATFEDEDAPVHASLSLTKADWMALGLSGTADSKARRDRLATALGVPTYLSANRLLELVNTTVTAEEWEELLKDVE
ncbi:MAG: DUF4093 domain-containing protein [Clostridia bacterium]|nr:DUF4093 domain-containing protein [Clostridia bacterium]